MHKIYGGGPVIYWSRKNESNSNYSWKTSVSSIAGISVGNFIGGNQSMLESNDETIDSS